jgi:cytochrome c biogenesis protein CcdA
VLSALLAGAAFLAGVTGSWSPCGLSMIETLGPGGHDLARGSTRAGCIAFLPGALLGGVATFGALSIAGALLHAGGGALLAGVALGIALLAVLADAAGLAVRPQVRRQVPEAWRRRLPLPAAAFGYGVLLGLGWTTYVLSFAVWALFAIALAAGDPALGVLAGLAFGLGRALPIVALAPAAERPAGLAVAAIMAERPGLLRGLRALDAAAVAACAAALAPATALAAPTRLAAPASDPSAAGGDVAWELPSGGGVLLRGGRPLRLAGDDPVLGESRMAWRDGDVVTVADRATLAPQAQFALPDAGELAVADRWLAWRSIRGPVDVMWALSLVPGATPRRIAQIAVPGQLGRPSLSGDRLAYHVASHARSAIRLVDLGTGRRRTVLRGRGGQVLNPALYDPGLLYVRLSSCRQRLRLRSLRPGGRDRVLATAGPLGRRDEGHEHHHTAQGSEPTRCPDRLPRARETFWTTALDATSAYLVTVRDGRPTLRRYPRTTARG